jgi:hypothetical protein
MFGQGEICAPEPNLRGCLTAWQPDNRKMKCRPYVLPFWLLPSGRRSGLGHWRVQLEENAPPAPRSAPIGGLDALPIGVLTRTIMVLHSRPCSMPGSCWLPWLTQPQPWSMPLSRRELTMRPTSIPFACPLSREQAFPIAFLARPQLLTRP